MTKKEKSPIEIIAAQRKAETFKHRKRLISSAKTDKDFALNMALKYISKPSLETLLWLNHYLRKI